MAAAAAMRTSGSSYGLEEGWGEKLDYRCTGSGNGARCRRLLPHPGRAAASKMCHHHCPPALTVAYSSLGSCLARSRLAPPRAWSCASPASRSLEEVEKERITDEVAAGEVSPTLSGVLEMKHLRHSRRLKEEAGKWKEALAYR
jgi:hypothetical protein